MVGALCGLDASGLECPTVLSCTVVDTLIRTVSAHFDCYF
ncbi:hypothetical protein ALO42_101597 [Pseudomonas syringae pv. atrofaciens]|uniref:Uncharacterized protein n=4 Tax=Pseudomonas syringae group TaxID=136849 RepID=A0A3M3UBL8_PSESJ|nr:hypothetical protein ALO42_101597 [Pseudomonas syringae pv. atrofaciens]KPX60197.1 hypothetical protein ALO39_101248 [Pseudomonas syringae pv. lapsa]RML53629.1 hypothetical protein ALQ93_101370 [Pseudomonas syringae pv. pisi]RML65794.1 hypothetical protein ALQ91_101217 [Pseudomonas syringae pv. syringae]RMU68204.1 hypothetical protein ALP24_101718 [Pseudomonas syringae pv. aptata]RMU82941.1 hypothetical protein ALP21_101215 [Pseudomonas savastanoi pv. phaseolicola]